MSEARYLVVIKYALDDLPLRLFDTETAARAYATHLRETSGAKAMRVLAIDCTAPAFCVWIYKFEGRDLMDAWVVKSF